MPAILIWSTWIWIHHFQCGSEDECGLSLSVLLIRKTGLPQAKSTNWFIDRSGSLFSDGLRFLKFGRVGFNSIRFVSDFWHLCHETQLSKLLAACQWFLQGDVAVSDPCLERVQCSWLAPWHARQFQKTAVNCVWVQRSYVLQYKTSEDGEPIIFCGAPRPTAWEGDNGSYLHIGPVVRPIE